MPADLWAAEDVELVARALKVEFGTAEGWDKAPDWIRAGYRESAVTVLAALAEAGRILPADAKRHENFRFRNRKLGLVRYTIVTPADMDATGWTTERQYEWVGPWLPVDPEPTPPTFLDRRAAADPSVDHASHSTRWTGKCPECPDDRAGDPEPAPKRVGDDSIERSRKYGEEEKRALEQQLERFAPKEKP